MPGAKAKTISDTSTFSRKRGIMRSCFIASFVFHIMALIVVNRAFPIKWVMKPLRVYHVELLRPAVKDMDLDKEAHGLARLIDTGSKPTPQGEDTISLDTTDKRYVSYARIIKEALMSQWQYPPEAKDNLLEGKTFLIFTLSRDGTLLDLKVLNSSGCPVLDNEAVKAVKAAAPFPAFPGSVTVARLHIKANFDYRLTGPGQARE